MPKLTVHRHIKLSVVIAIAIALILAAAYFLLEYRTAQVVKLLVERESKGKFRLDVEDVDFSFLKRKIELEQAFIQQVDTNGTAARSAITVPRLYLQLGSWSALIFNKKLIIDSLSLVSPSYEAIADTNSQNNAISFQASQIFGAVENVIALLNIRSFDLRKGTFTLHLYNSSVPIVIHDIQLSIRNFIPDANNSNRFLSADEIELLIPAQQWKLDENHEIKFGRLQFSGKKQYFQLDSMEFISYGEDQKSEIDISADKLSFKSDSLSAFYQNDELILDTLLCTHPVLWLHANADEARTDTTSSIGESLKKIFSNIHVHHFEIDDGQFEIEQVKEGKTSGYTTQKTDLKIEELLLRPNESPFLSIGDINMQLEELALYTPDSLYQLTLEEFALYNHEIHFRNAVFGPTMVNPDKASFLVTIPVLALHRLNADDLIEGRLGADEAEMESPVITITSSGKQKTKESSDGNMTGFYRALHGLNDLLHVRTLNITHATVKYLQPTDSFKAELHDFNTSVSLTNFLTSRTLKEIKHSIPDFHVGEIFVHTKTVDLLMNNFRWHGTAEPNGISQVEIKLKNGMTIESTDFFWHTLDWDSLKFRNAIFLDSVNMGKLSITGNQNFNEKKKEVGNLPYLHVRKFGAEKLKIQYQLAGNSEVTARGEDILFSDVSTSGNILLWSSAIGDFTSLKYKSQDLNASVDKIHFEFPGQIRFKDVQADIINPSTTLHAVFPELKVATAITSTDFSNPDFSSVIINGPKIDLTQATQDSAASKPLSFPLNLTVRELQIVDGHINYFQPKENDSLQFSSSINLLMKSAKATKDNAQLLNFQKLDATLSTLDFRNKKIKLMIPSTHFTISNGHLFDEQGKLAFQSMIESEWNDASAQMNFKKESQMDITDFSGGITSASLNLVPGEKMEWCGWLNYVIVSNAKVSLADSMKLISFDKVVWDPTSESLKLDSFHLQPKESKADYFGRTPWQSDYISIRSGSAIISGIDPDQWRKDSVLKIHVLNLQNFYLDVSRDKRIPFHHGIEKLMPTQLLGSVQTRFSIDSVMVQNSNVNYHEFSDLTNREGTVPIENINAVMKKFGNDHEGRMDTLSIKGTAQLLSCYISKFHYKEVYHDTLSGFKLTVKTWPTQLTDFSKLTNPLAAIDVSSGKCDTLIARASGNKYAAVGQMQFYYKDLKVYLLNRQDTMNRRLSLAFVNFVANNFVIKPKNHKDSKIFFVRDRERFVFNYWSKMVLSGVLSSAGIKSNRKYSKQYQRMKQQYRLPPENL